MSKATHALFAIERRYDHAPSRVFAAWSDPKAKRTWFVEGEGWEIASFEMDFREGGSERSSFTQCPVDGKPSTAPPGVFSNETTYHHIAANRRIIFSYSMLLNGVRFSVSLATVELNEDGRGTRLLFTEQAAFLEGGDGPKMREEGWTVLLTKLEQHLAAGR